MTKNRHYHPIILDEADPDKIKAILQQGLREYNRNHLGEYELKRFSLHTENTSSEIIAGIYGFILEKHKTLRLELVWVDPRYRHEGLGTELLKRAEEYAIKNHCNILQVSTMEFQGQYIYEKLGYKKIGSISNWFCNKDELYFIKELSQ